MEDSGRDPDLSRDLERLEDMTLWPRRGRTDGAAAAMTPNVASSLELLVWVSVADWRTYTAHRNKSTRSPGCVSWDRERLTGHSQVGSFVVVKLGTSAVRMSANAPLLLSAVSNDSNEESHQLAYANPKAINPQIPTLTRRGSWIFHRKMTGRIDRTKSVAAAIAAKVSLSSHKD